MLYSSVEIFRRNSLRITRWPSLSDATPANVELAHHTDGRYDGTNTLHLLTN